MSCDVLELAAPGVRALQPYQPGKPESELRREYGLSEIVKLASNENPLGPSPKALAAAREALAGIARYPDGNGFELKAVLAAHHRVPESQVTLGNGSNDLLEMIARAFLTPQHEAVFSEHAFAVYPLATLACSATARVAKANGPDHAMPYGHDLDAMAALVNDRTRVVFVANHNNPTGTWLNSDELEAFVAQLPAHVIVVIDEAYTEYVDQNGYSSAIDWVARYPNLVVTRTFSKIYGLAGLRVGYAVSKPEVADLLNRVRQPFNVNMPAQTAAVAALADSAHIERSRTTNQAGLEQLRQAFERMGAGYLPTVGNFICARFDRPGREIFQALLPKGVIIRPIDNYGLPEYVRITIGTERENQILLDALQSL